MFQFVIVIHCNSWRWISFLEFKYRSNTLHFACVIYYNCCVKIPVVLLRKNRYKFKIRYPNSQVLTFLAFTARRRFPVRGWFALQSGNHLRSYFLPVIFHPLYKSSFQVAQEIRKSKLKCLQDCPFWIWTALWQSRKNVISFW